MLHVCLIRHGETDWNVAGRLQGSTDIELNAHGVRQAHAAARVLGEIPIDALYASDLSRASVTAEIIGEALDLPVQPEPRLRERNLGLLQGLSPADAMQCYPEVYGRIKAKIADYLPPKGETAESVAYRAFAALEDLARRHAGQSVVAVTHGGVLDVIYRRVVSTGFSVSRTWLLRNCALNWLMRDEAGWHVQSWDEHEHLHAVRDEQAI